MAYDIDIDQIDQNSKWASSHVPHLGHDITYPAMIACDESNAYLINFELDTSKPSE